MATSATAGAKDSLPDLYTKRFRFDEPLSSE